jgi:hypothetical protein
LSVFSADLYDRSILNNQAKEEGKKYRKRSGRNKKRK